MTTRTWLPLVSSTLLLAACSGRAPDHSAPAAADSKKETVKVGARPFAWPLEQQPLATRGGTSTGAPVTLSPAPAQAWQDLVAMPTGFERDRAAIRAMAGEYRIAFDFQETVALRPGYELSAPYFSWATERIWVLDDTPTRIVLQHQLLMRFAGHGDEPVVIKHWRQDWTWQDSNLLRYHGRARWRHEKIDPEQAVGTWSQAVYGVGDEPRFESFGRWIHDGEMSAWTGDRTWRPRPRREKTVRKDYDVMEGSHRITITPDGWVLWQDNRKLKLAEDGTPLRDGLIATEIGLERYQRLDGFDWKPAIDLWEHEKAEWAAVRASWSEVLASENILLTGEENVGIALMESVAGEDPQAGPKAVHDAVVKPGAQAATPTATESPNN